MNCVANSLFCEKKSVFLRFKQKKPQEMSNCVTSQYCKILTHNCEMLTKIQLKILRIKVQIVYHNITILWNNVSIAKI